MADYGKYIVGSINGYDFEFWRKYWDGDYVTPAQLATGGIVLNLIDGDFENTVSKTTVDITFRDNTIASYYNDFFTADATKYKFFLKKGDDIIWSGYVTPDSYSFSTGTQISITCRDNIGYLDQLDFDLTGVQTIDYILEQAQSRISWLPAAWQWVGGYSAEGGTISYGDSEIDCDNYSDTWGEILADLLVGYQLRYVGNNTWNIYEITELEKLDSITYLKSIGDTSWEVVPSWNTYTTTHDYGLATELFEYEQDEDNFIYSHTTSYPLSGGNIDFYSIEHDQISSPSVLNNYSYSNSSSSSSQYVDYMFMQPTHVYCDDDSTDTYYGEAKNFVYYRNFGAGENISLALECEFNDSAFSLQNSPDYLILFNYYDRISSSVELRFDIQYHGLDGSVKYFSSRYWQDTQESDIVFRSDEDSSVDSTSSITINIASIPAYGGTLFITVKPEIRITILDDVPPPIYAYLAVVGIKSMSLSLSSSAENDGQELTGLINEQGNVKEELTVVYGETPTNVGGIGLMAYGLYKDSESITNWQRIDEIGGVMNLTENISRAYAHLSNAFYSGTDERSGGLTISAKFKDFKPSNIYADGKKYVLTSYEWDITTDNASINGRQIAPYEYAEAYEWDANTVGTGGSNSLSSGNSAAITWGSSGNSSELVIKRIYELETETDVDGSYVILDKSGNDSAKKYSISNFLTAAGGIISGSLQILTDLIVDGVTTLATLVSNLIKSSNYDEDTNKGFKIYEDEDKLGHAKLNSVNTDEVKTPSYPGTAISKKGVRIYEDEDGRGVVDASIVIAEELQVDVLTYNQIRATGSGLVVSAAWMTVTSIEVLETGGIKFFYKPDDGLQLWRVGDQPRMVNAGRYYWGVVIAVSESLESEEHWIMCSTEDVNIIGDPTTVVEGDEFVLYGYRGDDDTQRQNLIYITTGSASDPTPSVNAYSGISSFVVSDSVNRDVRLARDFVAGNTEFGMALDPANRSFKMYGASFSFENGTVVTPEEISAESAAAQAAADAADAKAVAAATAAAAAQALAETAIDNAAAAQADATTALDNIDKAVSDGWLTPAEKVDEQTRLSGIVSEKDSYIAQATQYSVSYTSYNTAYTSLYNYLINDAEINDTSDSTAIDSNEFIAYYDTYYSERQSLLEDISTAVQSYTDDSISNISIGGVNLADGTSSDWSTENSITQESNYTVVMATKGNMSGLTVGSYITARVELIFKDIASSATPQIKVQGPGNVTGWLTGRLDMPYASITTTGSYEFIYEETTVVTEDNMLNSYWSYINLRINNIYSGTVSFRNLKIESGTKATSWSPSINDTTDAIEAADTKADEGIARLDNIDSDNVFSVSEKNTQQVTFESISGRDSTSSISSDYASGGTYALALTQATAYNVDFASLQAYYSTLHSNFHTWGLYDATDYSGGNYSQAELNSMVKEYYAEQESVLLAVQEALTNNAIDNISYSSVNLLNNSNSDIASRAAGETIIISSELETGATYTWRVESTSAQTSGYVQLYVSADGVTYTSVFSDTMRLYYDGSSSISKSFTATDATKYVKVVRLYAYGATISGREILVKGNKIDSSWSPSPNDVPSAVEYLTESLYNKSVTNFGLALGEVLGVVNGDAASSSASDMRAFMSGLSGDGLAFGAHGSDAYTIAYNYVNGNSTTRPKFAVTDTGQVIADGADITNLVADSASLTNATVSGEVTASTFYAAGSYYTDYNYASITSSVGNVQVIISKPAAIIYNTYSNTIVILSTPKEPTKYTQCVIYNCGTAKLTVSGTGVVTSYGTEISYGTAKMFGWFPDVEQLGSTTDGRWVVISS